MSAAIDTPATFSRSRRAGGMRELTALAWPVVLTNLSQTLMMVADTAMVGRLGAAALGAVGYGGIWYWTMLSGFSGAASGVQTFVSQADGAGHPRQCGAWVWQGWYAVAPLGALALALFALGFPALLELLQPDAALRPFAADYVHGRALGAPALLTAMVVAAFLRGVGDTRTPLYAMIAANLLNLVLNYGLIYGNLGLPAWGVFGSAVATATAEWLYAAWLLIAVRRAVVARRYATQSRAPQWESMRRFARTSAPIAGQWWLDMLAFAAFSTVVARMGTSEMAASQAMLSLMHLSFMFIVGVQMAVATLVGRYIGAGDLAAAARSRMSAVWLGLAWSVAASLLYLSAPELALGLFTSDGAVLRLGAPLLLVGAAFQICDALGVLNGGALRGAGDTRWPFLAQTILAWGLFLPAAWVCGDLLDGGLTGAWIGGVIYVAVLGAALHWRFSSGAWRRVRI
ncbi:MAG: MATE family efflux transporter [Deltaproteobacteria bacterium]|nr:MATE family efflux transporter [Deltaproteobacteria bacterium]